MLERFEPCLKLVLLGLAALLVLQFARIMAVKDPLENADTSFAFSAPAESDDEPVAKITRPGNARGPAKKAPPVPASIQTRAEHITESEVFGPVQRPLPMALLGIAGADAFIRAPNGQTGLLREGEELGELKLLQIGTNRALIELEGQQKELTLYPELGGESLLPKR